MKINACMDRFGDKNAECRRMLRDNYYAIDNDLYCKWRRKRDNQLRRIRSPQQLRAQVGVSVYDCNMLMHVGVYNVSFKCVLNQLRVRV